MEQIVQIVSRPGIKRDGTRFDSDHYADGLWCRFDRERPRKIGGYTRRTNALRGITRAVNLISRAGQSYVHCGSQAFLERIQIDNATGVASGVNDRTPGGFVANTDNLWQIETMYDGGSTAMAVVAHAAPNASMISNDVAQPVYIGSAYGTGALTAIASSSVSGGIVALFPYLFRFGDDGLVGWSVANTPADTTGVGSGTARVTGAKIVAGRAMRAGAGVAPAGLFWSLNSLVRVTFAGGTAIWNFDTVSARSSIMSAASVVEYDNVFYWVGSDKFFMYNGVTREVPNDFNRDWFFDNVNPSARGKVFGFQVPKFGEIWWCFPFGDAVEPTHAVIYNVRHNIWYDTALPAGGRSAAHYAETFPYPIMTGATATGDGNTSLYQHEVGFDAVEDMALAIRSYFETADMSSLPPAGANGHTLSISRVEPDFIQSGSITVRAIGRANSRAADVVSSVETVVETAVQPYEQVVNLKDANFRQARFRFESNELGGNYFMGKVVGVISKSDGTFLGATES